LTPVRTDLPAVFPVAETGWITRLDTALRGLTADRILVHAPWEHRFNLLIHALQQTHTLEKSTLIIVGEVARAEWLGRLITESTGFPVILIHSDLDEAVRLNRWKQIQDVPTIVVGTRSAVFAPLRSLGLVWIEGEENPALKEPQEPRFHARDVAWMRAQAEGVPLVLGSSHPSLESYWADGMHVLSGPASDANAPLVEVVDLRREPRGSLFSSRLLAAVRDSFERKDRMLLFLNRKGFAGALVCRDCGWVPRCAVCTVAFAFFRHIDKLACRYCGESLALPDLCPTCGSTRLHPVGEGTERIEVEARRLLPNARILRIDGSTLRGAAAARDLWRTAFSGDWDVLIGTQALFQREPLPSVGLCGILQADSGMNIPDFRAAERTYQLLGNAISLVRPAASGGRVILQTLWPSHHVIEALSTGNPSRFYHEELAARRLLGYPPALHLIALSISGKHLSSVEQAARQVVQHLEQSSSKDMAVAAKPISGHSVHASSKPAAAVREHIAILGPVPAAGGGRRGQLRHQILVKGSNRAFLLEAVSRSVKAVEATYRGRHLKVSVDVDPVEMA
jgi:primosomal protein N' (replication factor Y)